MLMQENQPAEDIDLTCFKTFPIKATKYNRVLQVGILVATSLTEVCDVLFGTLGVSLDRFFFAENRELKLKYFRKLLDNNNILCLQEIHGKDEYLQAIQVLAPRFRFFGTFIPGNENCWRIGLMHPQGTSA